MPNPIQKARGLIRNFGSQVKPVLQQQYQPQNIPGMLFSPLAGVKTISNFKPTPSGPSIGERVGNIPMLSTGDVLNRQSYVPLREYFNPRSYSGGPAGQSIANYAESAMGAFPISGGATKVGKMAFSLPKAIGTAGVVGGLNLGLSALRGQKPTVGQLAPNMALGFVMGGIQPRGLTKGQTTDAVKRLRNNLTKEDVGVLGRFAEIYETKGERAVYGQVGRDTQSLATELFGKEAATWSNRKMKNVFDFVLGKVGQGANQAGLGLTVKSIRKEPITKIVGEPKAGGEIGATLQKSPQLAGLTTKGVVQTKPIQPGAKLAGGQLSGGQGIPSSENIIPLNDKDLVTRLSQALKEAEPIRGGQEELYAKARGEKLAKLMAVRERIGGEKGFYQELGALKGELPKVQYEPIRQQFNEQNVNRLFDMVKETKALDDWEKVNAQVGLAKILGEKGVGVPTKGEIEKLYKVFGKEFTETLLSKRPFFTKLGELGMQLYNLPRSMMAGVGDLSATFMQNMLFAYRHPLTTSKNFVKQLTFFKSEGAYRTSMEEIAQRPTYDLMKQAKISLTEVSPIMSQREEQFMASWAEKIPGLGRVIRATGRAYTGFLNKMRADVFDQLITSAKETGKDVKNPQFLKSLGEFINAGTGRGSLGSLERSAPLLAQGLFSARKLAASAQMINPVFYIKADPFVRKEALKTMLAFLGGATTITGLAKLAGADVSSDPTSADFGKIKIGNTRFNMYGTYQQIAVLIGRLWKGYATSSTTGKRMTLGEGYKPLTRLDLITRFFESKEHPTLSLISSALQGQNQIGQPFNLPAEVLNRFIPMVLGDAYDLYKEHGGAGLLGTIPTILGIPSQTYGTQELVTGKNQLGQPTSQVKESPTLSEKITSKVFGQPPLQPTSQGNVDTYFKQLQKLPPVEAARQFDEIAKSNPELAKKIMQSAKDFKLGITPNDETMKAKGVANGDRAVAIVKEFKKLKTNEEKAKLWDGYVKKGIITTDVAKQLMEMKKRGEF